MSKVTPVKDRTRRASLIKRPVNQAEGKKSSDEPHKKKLKVGRPRKNKVFCTWCREGTLQLPYVFPCAEGKKEFCSESCLAEFSKARTRKVSESNGHVEDSTKVKNEEAISLENSNVTEESRQPAEIKPESQTPNKSAPSPVEKQSKLSSEKELATSTTHSPVGLEADPNLWSVDNVIQYISSADQLLTQHAELFYKHEIDGRAFLLLNFDMMMKYMGLKLGPALKICNLITKLTKGRRFV